MDKLSRTQTVSVRLDPKLRYLSEIAARKQRRTLSSFIEWTLENTLSTIFLADAEGKMGSLNQLAPKLWDVEPADRFVKLAFHYPDLLDHHEEIVWKLIRENGYLWRGEYPESTNTYTWKLWPSNLIHQKLRNHWDVFNKVASGEAPKTELPTWQETRSVPTNLGFDEPPDPEDDLEDIPG
jgi:hypothetical protein